MKSGTDVLRTSESKDLDRERRNEAWCELDEMDLPWWCHPFNRAEIAQNHDENKVCCRVNGRSDRYSVSFVKHATNESLTAGEESDVACMSKTI